jgi:uncharacterized protein (TIGR00369 family)
MRDEDARVARARQVVETAIAASPLARRLGARIAEIAPEAGRVSVQFSPGPEFVQAFDVIQGGVVATMLDFAMAFAAHAHLPEGVRFASASLNVAYLRPAETGSYLAVGEIEKAGRSLIFARATLRRDDDTPVATATSVIALART